MENQENIPFDLPEIQENQKFSSFQEVINNYKPSYKQKDFSTLNQNSQQKNQHISNRKMSSNNQSSSKSPQKKSKLYGLLNGWKVDKSARSLSLNDKSEEKPIADLTQSVKYQKGLNDVTISNFLSQNSLNLSSQYLESKSPIKKKTSVKDNQIYSSHIAQHKKQGKDKPQSQQIQRFISKNYSQKKEQEESIENKNQIKIQLKDQNSSQQKKGSEELINPSIQNDSENYKKANQKLNELLKLQKNQKYENKKVTENVNKKRPQEQHLFDYKIPKQITHTSSNSNQFSKIRLNQSLSLPQKNNDVAISFDRSQSSVNNGHKLNRSLSTFNTDFGYGEVQMIRRNSQNYDKKQVQYTFLSDKTRKILQEKEKKVKEMPLHDQAIEIELIPEKNEEYQPEDEQEIYLDESNNHYQNGEQLQQKSQNANKGQSMINSKNSKNSQKSQNQKNSNTIWEKLYTDHQKLQKKKRDYLNEKYNMEQQYIQENCTFQPVLNEKKARKQKNSGQEINSQDSQQEIGQNVNQKQSYNNKGSGGKNTDEVWRRNQEWINKKQQKLKQIENQYKDRDLKDCTFKPRINNDQAHLTYQDQIFKNINTPASQSAFKGIDQYVKRQIIARKNKQEKEFLQNNPYSHLIPAQIKGNSYSLNMTGIKKNPKTTQQLMTIQQQHYQWSQQKEQERLDEEMMVQQIQAKRQQKIQQLSQSNCYSDLIQNLHENLHDMSMQ